MGAATELWSTIFADESGWPDCTAPRTPRESELSLERALAIFEKTLEPADNTTFAILHNLLVLDISQAGYSED
jgi:hypothetical protein